MFRQKRAALLGSILAGLTVAPLVMLAGSSIAATAPGAGNGLQISPVTTNLTVNPGDSQVVTVNITNVTAQQATFQVLINDFTASPGSETGTPALLLNPGEYAPSHSLKRYITPIPDLTLGAHEQKGVPVSITIPKGTSGGGYYGAVRFAPSTLDASKNVNLAASVASLILVRVPGNFKEQLNLASFEVRDGKNGTPRALFTNPDNIVVAARFENVGDVQDQPFGKILLRQDSKQLGDFEINSSTPKGNVLPSSTRLFTVKLDKVGVFGRYTVYGNFGYGAEGQLLSGQTTFYVVPLPAILAVVIVIALILFFIFGFPRLMRQYNQMVIQRARRR